MVDTGMSLSLQRTKSNTIEYTLPILKVDVGVWSEFRKSMTQFSN